jgi:hypothetical protein
MKRARERPDRRILRGIEAGSCFDSFTAGQGGPGRGVGKRQGVEKRSVTPRPSAARTEASLAGQVARGLHSRSPRDRPGPPRHGGTRRIVPIKDAATDGPWKEDPGKTRRQLPSRRVEPGSLSTKRPNWPPWGAAAPGAGSGLHPCCSVVSLVGRAPGLDAEDGHPSRVLRSPTNPPRARKGASPRRGASDGRKRGPEGPCRSASNRTPRSSLGSPAGAEEVPRRKRGGTGRREFISKGAIGDVRPQGRTDHLSQLLCRPCG